MQALCNHLMNFGAKDVESLLITQLGKRPFGLLCVTYPISQPDFVGSGVIQKPAEKNDGNYEVMAYFAVEYL